MAKRKPPEVNHSWLEARFATWNKTLGDYLARRPHRSFRRTYRRDYARSFKLPGYIGLTAQSVRLIVRNWRLFGVFFLVYSIATAIVLGVVNQSSYSSLVSTLKTANVNAWLRTFTVFGTAITGGLNNTSSGGGPFVSVIAGLLAWLVLVWLLRHVVAGSKVKFREGLYSAGSPLISTTLVVVIAAIQCIPLVLVAIGFSAASSTGVLSNSIEALFFYGAAGLLVLLSLYWLTSTFIAMIIVTLPGMYPMAAIKAAGDLVVGRRMRLILRLLWLAVAILVLWVIVLVPIIALDGLVSIGWLPLVPATVLGLTTASLILASTYIYLLYRKLVDDEAKPA